MTPTEAALIRRLADDVDELATNNDATIETLRQGEASPERDGLIAIFEGHAAGFRKYASELRARAAAGAPS